MDESGPGVGNERASRWSERDSHVCSAVGTAAAKIALECGGVFDALHVQRPAGYGFSDPVHKLRADVATHVSRFRGGSRENQRHVGARLVGHNVGLDFGPPREWYRKTLELCPDAPRATQERIAGSELSNEVAEVVVGWIVLAIGKRLVGVDGESMAEGQHSQQEGARWNSPAHVRR